MVDNIGPESSVPSESQRVVELSQAVSETVRSMLLRFNEMNTRIVGVLREFQQPRSEQYVTRAGRDDAVEWNHDQIVLRPQAKMPPREEILEMKLRFPLEGATEVNTQERRPRDVFTELMYSNGVFLRYLINDDGIASYRAGADIELKDDVDIQELESSSIFRVTYAPEKSPEIETEKLATIQLIQELLVAYRPVPHPNTPTIDAA